MNCRFLCFFFLALTTIVTTELVVNASYFPTYSWPPGVKWEQSAGGNGHSYEVKVRPGGIFWNSADYEARKSGGYLATPTSSAENDFIFNLAKNTSGAFRFWPTQNEYAGPWLGGYQLYGSTQPGGGWTWVTGEKFDYTRWIWDAPNNSFGYEDRIHYLARPTPTKPEWNDYPFHELHTVPGPQAYIIEYERTNIPILFEDFENAPIENLWDRSEILQIASSSQRAGSKVLGPFSNESATLSLDNLPRHQYIEITFDLLIIGNWEGNGTANGKPDIFSLSLGSQYWLTHASFSNIPGKAQSYPGLHGENSGPALYGALEVGSMPPISINGSSFSNASIYRIRHTFYHPGDFTDFVFSASGVTAAAGKFWAIDNVLVSLRVLDPDIPAIVSYDPLVFSGSNLNVTLQQTVHTEADICYLVSPDATLSNPDALAWNCIPGSTALSIPFGQLSATSDNYLHLKRKYHGGLQSGIVSAGPIKLADGAAASVGDLKANSIGNVILRDVVVTAGTGQLPGKIYVQSPDRSSGIAVSTVDAFSVGDIVDIYGRLTTIGGERIIADARGVLVGTGAPVVPLNVTLKHAVSSAFFFDPVKGLGQRAVTDVPGGNLSTIGLLLRSPVQIFDIDGSFVFVNDGSFPGYTGIRVDRTYFPGDIGVLDHAIITGISSLRQSGPVYQMLLRPRSPLDIEKINLD